MTTTTTTATTPAPTVAVLGAGTMGSGIAQVFAQHGHTVILRDVGLLLLAGQILYATRRENLRT